MNLLKNQSVNLPGLWYNNNKKLYSTREELLHMGVKKTSRSMRNQRVRQSVRRGISFRGTRLLIRNELDSTCGVPDDILSARFTKAVDNAIAIKKIKGQPIAMYDKGQKQAYLEYPDGRKIYV